MTGNLEIDTAMRIVLPMVSERSREPGDAWDKAATALTALRADLAAAVARANSAQADAEGWARKCAVADDRADAAVARAEKAEGVTHDALIELCQEVSFFLEGFSVGKPVYADRLKSALDNARAALPDAKGGE